MPDAFDPQAFTAERLREIPFSEIRKVSAAAAALAAAGKDVIHWYIGRPDFDTPAHIKRAAIESLENGDVHYAPNLGVEPLRRAIAERTKIDTGVAVDWETQVNVTVGANEAVLLTMLTFLNPGDEVIVPEPNWYHYKWCAALAGGISVPVPTREEEGFTLQAEEVARRVTPRTKLLCVTSPGNPTGSVIPEGELKKLAELANERNLLVLSDEIYTRLYYGEGEVAQSIFSLPGMAERTIVVNSFSKAYSMDGWRLGWTVASPALTQSLWRARQYTTVCANTFIQHAAAHALTADQSCVAEMRDAFNERRKIILEGLRAIEGVTAAVPEGAFYFFPNVKAFGKNSAEVADRLLQEYAIATVDGAVFGDCGEGYLRIAYSCSTEDCVRGVERLGVALEKLR